ncbi:MAG: hypothetical protein KatS3mg017_0089 [Fimbriimonadales bacterium]|nr:MAG: hypothetical protein KatS3mg017_0089 [Fimbriimonadales bacterium]GIV09827.1 MAG: hypothetical protein KatS3mg019_1918 [Fimbriimonadales bacterium]
MNRWVRIGLVILALAILARVGLAIFALGLRVVFAFFPLVILVGAGFVVYGLYRHWRRRAALYQREYYDMLDD